jgi:hypothetical protein
MTSEQAKQYEMPFGPHRGIPLMRIERKYLEELSEEILLLKQYPTLKEAIKQLLKPGNFAEAKRFRLSDGRTIEEVFSEDNGLAQLTQLGQSAEGAEKEAIDVVLNTINLSK